MRGTTRITHLGVRVPDLEPPVMIAENFEAASQTAEIVYIADKVPSHIRYAAKRGNERWRIAAFQRS